MHCPHQVLTNYGLGVPCLLLKIKFSWNTANVHLFTYCLWLLLSYKDKFEKLQWRLYGLKNPKYLLTCP